jgi:hypothetical protein
MQTVSSYDHSKVPGYVCCDSTLAACPNTCHSTTVDWGCICEGCVTAEHEAGDCCHINYGSGEGLVRWLQGKHLSLPEALNELGLFRAVFPVKGLMRILCDGMAV